ncbi:hypothetical protein SB775_33285, partial [Peribacillus sp. SIMBA_075]|uniref:hypothetical protein n=1 Tax=Peribacillus sp. SIMBA_075 TaxID=3085813 RepID=UPI00397AE203
PLAISACKFSSSDAATFGRQVLPKAVTLACCSGISRTPDRDRVDHLRDWFGAGVGQAVLPIRGLPAGCAGISVLHSVAG